MTLKVLCMVAAREKLSVMRSIESTVVHSEVCGDWMYLVGDLHRSKYRTLISPGSRHVSEIAY